MGLGGGIGWAECDGKLLIFHYKPGILFKLCACIALVKVSNFKNAKVCLVILV